jgi:hypothetical protein
VEYSPPLSCVEYSYGAARALFRRDLKKEVLRLPQVKLPSARGLRDKGDAVLQRAVFGGLFLKDGLGDALGELLGEPISWVVSCGSAFRVLATTIPAGCSVEKSKSTSVKKIRKAA